VPHFFSARSGHMAISVGASGMDCNFLFCSPTSKRDSQSPCLSSSRVRSWWPSPQCKRTQGKTDCAHASVDHWHALALPLTPESVRVGAACSQSHVSILSLPYPPYEHTALYYGSSLLLSFAKTMGKPIFHETQTSVIQLRTRSAPDTNRSSKLPVQSRN
jgi:hypothetical protein